MASWAPFAAPFLGALAGFAASLLTERLKNGLAPLDAELVRIDTIHDEAVDALALIKRASSAEAQLISIVRQRGRLGKNLKRELGRRHKWPAVSTGVALYAKVLGKVEDIQPASPGADFQALEDELDSKADALRMAVKQAAAESRVWRLLRGS